MLTKDQILNASDLETKEIDVPEWGGKVKIRSLTGAQSGELDRHGFDKPGYYELIVALSIVGDDGNPMFDRTEIAALGKKSHAALRRVVDAANELNARGDEHIEEIEKNSESGQTNDSGSD